MLETDEIRLGDFLVNDEGVFYIDKRKEKEEVIEICSPLIATAITRNNEDSDWGKLFMLLDPVANVKQFHMRNAALAGQRQGVISDLIHKGLMLSGHPRALNLLGQYLRSVRPQKTILSSAKPGWVDTSFVLPDRSFGQNEVVYSGAFTDHGLGVSGDWKSNVGKYCSGNSRLLFAASTAFAAPLLSVVGLEGGGFHLRGLSSVGKSTALEVAASVYGSPAQYLLGWDTTKNSLEEIAEAHNDCLMVIDELGLVDPAVIGDALYMIANGQGKARMRQAKRRWRVLFLTSGEVSLAEHMAEAGKEPKKGQEVRLLDIAADAGMGMGLFEELHSFGAPAELANHLKTTTRQHYGTPLHDFLSRMTEFRDAVESDCRSEIDRFASLVTPSNVTGEVPRAIRRFGVVAAAGEIATAWGITGWERGAATAAAETCFRAWMQHRRTFDPVSKAVDQVRSFIAANQTRFENGNGNEVQNRVGYKKRDTFLIIPAIFQEEVCAGTDHQVVADGLEQAGYLNTSGPNRKKKQERIDGRLEYFYSISESILEAA